MQNGFEVFFLDESGFILTDYKIYGWYLKGSRPVKPFIFDKNKRRNLAGAFSTNGFIISKCYEKMNSDSFLDFIKHLKEQYPKLLLIMDNVQMHLTDKLRTYYKENNIHIIKLPKYSPQLNPIEQYWKNIKQWLGTRSPLTINDLNIKLNEAINDESLCPNSYGYIVT
jgi:transposase